MNQNSWKNLSFVAFDTETSGAYPIGNEIVEVGLVKWEGGREVGSFNQLIRPRKSMEQEVIDIHGITNEMLKDAPIMSEVISSVIQFIGESIVIAHHAPFDLGFLSWDLERFGYALPKTPALCTSLLSRKLIKGSDNHKLQTLIKFLKLESGPAHRAESDARACLQVALHCFNLLSPETNFQDLLKIQEKDLSWKNYSIKALQNDKNLRGLIDATINDQLVDFVYMSGSFKGKTRRAKPLGIVRNPDGDYLSAFCLVDNKKKRFYLNAIKDSLPVFGS